MLSAFFSGFFISLSLILAIGPQNSFVIRQGLLNQYVLAVVLFCGISDAVLICLGVLGLGTIMAPVFTQYSDWMFGLSALWLAIYSIGRVRAAHRGDYPAAADSDTRNPESFRAIFALLAVLTFANPHVYLDTVILLGGGIYQLYRAGKAGLCNWGIACQSQLFCHYRLWGKKAWPVYAYPQSLADN